MNIHVGGRSVALRAALSAHDGVLMVLILRLHLASQPTDMKTSGSFDEEEFYKRLWEALSCWMLTSC